MTFDFLGAFIFLVTSSPRALERLEGKKGRERTRVCPDRIR
jgi:hypothetical protein